MKAWALLAMLVLAGLVGGNDGDVLGVLGIQHGRGPGSSRALTLLMSKNWPTPGPTPDRGAVEAVRRTGLRRDAPHTGPSGENDAPGRDRVLPSWPPEQWRDLIAQYPWDRARAYAVMMCESGGNTLARNGPYVGGFQVDSVLHRWTVAQLEDPKINVAAAYELYERRGWQPWPSCP